MRRLTERFTVILTGEQRDALHDAMELTRKRGRKRSEQDIARTGVLSEVESVLKSEQGANVTPVKRGSGVPSYPPATKDAHETLERILTEGEREHISGVQLVLRSVTLLVEEKRGRPR